MWYDNMKNEIIAGYELIQSITHESQEFRDLNTTVWEISVKTLMNMAADRGAFIDQSQSLNLHVAEMNVRTLEWMHFYAWKLGLKTGIYHLRGPVTTNPNG